MHGQSICGGEGPRDAAATEGAGATSKRGA
ncbi:MAG: hypothetical protein K0R53_2249, partial [Burkholderiales bacterium]|nr:hypothetical protein [Burkholderiales bacterium]